jgi:peptidoglycan/xylan/chitin deacetylase (PgdA/CDA1 family)
MRSPADEVSMSAKGLPRIARRFRRYAIVGSLLACALVLAPSNAAFACEGSLTTRKLVLNQSSMTGFGSIQQLPKLPLAKNEYVITIDDGPFQTTTDTLLDTLKSWCIHGTFFLVGGRAERKPKLVQRILSEGHGIGGHSLSHPDFSKLNPDEILTQIRGGNESIEKAMGHAERQVTLFRFPGGGGSPVVQPADLQTAHSLGLIVAGYDISPEDWRGSPANESFARFQRVLRREDRGVIVMHDAQPHTLELLPLVLQTLNERGATIVELSVGAEQ